MNSYFLKNKFTLIISLAVIFNLTNIILTQWLIEIDDNLKSEKYEMISNELKLKDIDNNTFATAHHPINVFGSSSYKYEIRIEEDAIDIQINN